jgi:hypothetical protein
MTARWHSKDPTTWLTQIWWRGMMVVKRCGTVVVKRRHREFASSWLEPMSQAGWLRIDSGGCE